MDLTVTEIRGLLAAADACEFPALEEALAADGRKGVRSAVEACRRRLAAEAAEEARLEALYAFDRRWGAPETVVGLDEVGRGAVAGPLAVGAVVLPDSPRIPLLNDSKQLTPAQREETAARIKEAALAWSVYYIEPARIDGEGMAACLRAAFKGALDEVEGAGLPLSTVLVDGNPLGIDAREANVVKGDGTSAAIAAASIVAKVERDRFMVQLSSTFPQYGFSSHKGYGSAEHIEAIARYGLSPVHRASFCRAFQQQSLF